MHTALLHIHVLCIMCISQCTALAQVVYFIAPVKNPYRIGNDNCALMWLSLYYFHSQNTLAESSKKGRGDK